MTDNANIQDILKDLEDARGVFEKDIKRLRSNKLKAFFNILFDSPDEGIQINAASDQKWKIKYVEEDLQDGKFAEALRRLEKLDGHLEEPVDTKIKSAIRKLKANL